jgi:GNAT superfamily N-acetyltransferase
MSIQYSLAAAPFDPSLLDAVSRLGAMLFERPTRDLQWRLERMPAASVACAYVDETLVGFKAGYAMSRSKYYSWLGGVHPDHRRQGIASALMVLQHRWVREQGFDSIETATDQGNRAMAQVNLHCGFVVCGMRSKTDRVQILFSMRLA